MSALDNIAVFSALVLLALVLLGLLASIPAVLVTLLVGRAARRRDTHEGRPTYAHYAQSSYNPRRSRR